MNQQIYEELNVARVTLPESVHEDIRSGNVEKALHPSNYSDPAMQRVFEYVAGLTFFQRGLITDALVVSLRESHGARVQFLVQECGYALEGVGIEIRNDTVTEDETRPPEERQQPMKVIFAVNPDYEKMR